LAAATLERGGVRGLRGSGDVGAGNRGALRRTCRDDVTVGSPPRDRHHVTTTTTSARPPLRPESGPCELSVSDVWVTGFAKLMTESALRTLDVNQDGVLDVLLGFATGQRNTLRPYRQRRRSWGFGGS